MKIAIPLTGGKLSAHFGHCQEFAIIDADPDAKTIGVRDDVTPPPHEPGLYPAWLAERGATHIIAGGMGQKAQELFAQNKIAVVTGAPADDPEAIVGLFLQGHLVTGANGCDH
ncbi:MAG TPA: NifB/NifX family molybdenum-iron cluster-binding protein [Spirochaetia bacterium]|nr:NifB/NifX family molybdenum-iron cluster-binding protein [Spirochaetia bacterium]